MSLADIIAPGSGRLRLHFPAETMSIDYGEIWKTGEEAVSGLRTISDGKPVGVILTNTRACATILVGAIAIGQPLVSVPMPPGGSNLEWYGRFVRHVCAISGATMLLLDASLLPMMPPIGSVRLLSFDDALALQGGTVGDPALFGLTQFTSGSTADPKGIVLPGHKIVANLRAIQEWLQVTPGDGVCTWLPLSHDMGLIGTFLASLAGAAQTGNCGFDLVIMTPRMFMRSPSRWLTVCEEFGSTITAAPSYAYEMAALSRKHVRHLERLRACIVGGEPIRASALELFGEVFQDSGFDSTALCPAYGMAEAVLAVTGTRPGAHWRATELDALVPDSESFVSGASDCRIVACGTPLHGYEVRIDGDGVGEIFVKGPSVADLYADATLLPDAEGWFHTRDIGVIRDDELYVLGRTDDVFQVAGRNIYAIDAEACAGDVTGVYARRVVAVPEGSTLTLVAECELAFSDQASVRRVAQALKQQIVSRLGLAPQRILLTRRGSLPLTASGKIRRKPLVAALQASELKILAGSIG